DDGTGSGEGAEGVVERVHVERAAGADVDGGRAGGPGGGVVTPVGAGVHVHGAGEAHVPVFKFKRACAGLREGAGTGDVSAEGGIGIVTADGEGATAEANCADAGGGRSTGDVADGFAGGDGECRVIRASG